MNLSNIQQNLKFVEYPKLDTNGGQTYVICLDGTIFGHLFHHTQKQRTAFLASAVKMDAWTSQEWFCFCQILERSATINYVFVFPYMCGYVDTPNKWGFLCANLEVDNDADLPLKYESMIGNWSQQVIQYISKPNILPSEASNIIKLCGNDGFAALELIHLQLNPKMYISFYCM